MIVEINSYPKCGNTWLRYIFANLFNIDIHHGIPDIHQQSEKTLDYIEYVNMQDKNVGFYKSHITDNTKINPEKILCIYRHPLDIFLSSLNYFYVTNNKPFFNDGEFMSVESLYNNNLIDKYFNNYLEHVGSNYYNKLLGPLSNYFMYMDNVFNNPKVFTFQYESLYDDPVSTISLIIKELLDVDEFDINIDIFKKVDAHTKDSSNPFYWKSRKNNYFYYLNDNQISTFNKKYQDHLLKLDYYQ